MSERCYLSIVITTYQRNEWLTECLRSIEESVGHYRKKGGLQQLEIIISDDDPAQRVNFEDKFANVFENLNVHFVHSINQINLGDYYNRNNGINLSNGKWVKFIDDDDLIYKWSIEFMIEKLEESANANTVIFYLRDGFRHLKFPVVLDKEEVFKFHYLQYGLFHCSLVSAIFLKEDLIKNGCFKFRRFYGDFQIFHDMGINGTFYIYPIELGWYRIHDSQESTNNRKDVRITFNYLLYSYNFLYEKNFSPLFFKPVRGHCFATIKYSIKTANFNLLVNALFLFALLQTKISGFDHLHKKLRKNWEKYYIKKMLFNNNAMAQ